MLVIKLLHADKTSRKYSLSLFPLSPTADKKFQMDINWCLALLWKLWTHYFKSSLYYSPTPLDFLVAFKILRVIYIYCLSQILIHLSQTVLLSLGKSWLLCFRSGNREGRDLAKLGRVIIGSYWGFWQPKAVQICQRHSLT